MPAGVEELQEGLRAVSARAAALETRSFEEAPAATLLADLVPRAGEALDGAIELLARIMDRYESAAQPREESTPAPADAARFYADIDALVAAEHSATQISDLCLVARLELRGKRGRLRALGAADDHWAIISACASARRRLLKSAQAVDTALAQYERIAPVLGTTYATELTRSLEVRRAYTSFRRAVAGSVPADAGEVQRAMRKAAVALAVLVGRDVYEDLRVDDRMQVRSLQRRIIAWLQEGENGQARAGLKLWHDLSAFSGLLVEVNNRTELRDHDRARLAELRPLVEALGEAAPDAELRRALRTLTGRDDTLDDLLAPGAQPTGARLAPVLASIAATLSAQPASPLPADSVPVTGGPARVPPHPEEPRPSAAGEESQ